MIDVIDEFMPGGLIQFLFSSFVITKFCSFRLRALRGVPSTAIKRRFAMSGTSVQEQKGPHFVLQRTCHFLFMCFPFAFEKLPITLSCQNTKKKKKSHGNAYELSTNGLSKYVTHCSGTRVVPPSLCTDQEKRSARPCTMTFADLDLGSYRWYNTSPSSSPLP